MAIFAGASGLFFFGYEFGGPAFIWSYPIVGALTILTALCLAEAAGRIPLAGSLYQWSRHLSRGAFLPWMAGWLFVVTLMVVPSVIGPTLQQVLTTVSDTFLFVGGPEDIGTSATPNGATNAVILGCISLAITTFINIVGIKWTGRVTEAIVVLELVAVVVVIVALATQAKRGPRRRLRDQRCRRGAGGRLSRRADDREPECRLRLLRVRERCHTCRGDHRPPT